MSASLDAPAGEKAHSSSDSQNTTNLEFEPLSARKARYYRLVFKISAIWNFLMAGVFLLFYEAIFERFDMHTPQMVGWHHMTWAMIAIFGYGYWQVSRNLYRNHEIVKLGIMGKATFFGLFTWLLFHGGVHFVVWFGSVGDLICGLLFAGFLRHMHKTRLSGN